MAEIEYLRWTGDPECEPVRHYGGDAGFDLVVSQDVYFYIDEFKDVPLGISIQLPPGVWGMLTGRSSTLRRRGIFVNQGIIDGGYRGPLFVGCYNLSRSTAEIKRGERIAQIIPIRLEAPNIVLEHGELLGSSDRGMAAFGSTGT